MLSVIAAFGILLFAVAASENPLEWEFRLSGGLTPLSGRVEMRPNSTAPWGTICKDIFKETNFGAIAACNSAGLVGVTQALYKTNFGPGTGPIYLTNVACTASTTFIQNCSRSPLLQVGACVHFEDVGVECSPPVPLWKFKMVNGTAPSNGIVIFQPMPSLPWGTVYYFNFWYNSWVFNREVMCRTMGFNTSRATSGDPRLLGALNDVTSYPPYLYLQSCPTASTSHVGFCSYNQIGTTSWSGWNGLALDCDPPAPKLIGPVTVKLVNGVTPSSGLIWISTNASNASIPWVGITAEDVTNNQHGTPLFTQSITPSQKSVLMAVCTAAGFPNATNPIFGKYGFVAPPPDAAGNARLIGMKFNCSDSPGTTLGDCTVGPDLKTGYSRGTGSYAGVDCFPTALNFTTWEYRLVGGGINNATIGRVELRPNNTAPWLGICANNEFSTRGVLWTALCRSMGFNTSYGMRSQAPISGLGSNMYYLGFSQHPYCPTVSNNGIDILPNMSLKDCTLSPIGMHQCGAGADLIMDCGFPDAIYAEMRLVGSTKPGAGRLEMRPSPAYQWGTVADVWGANMNYDWEVRTAYRLCWSLGFLNVTNPILTPVSTFGPGNLTQPLWWSLVQCAAGDTNFRTCNAQYPFGFSYNYGHSMDMGVDCYPPPFEPIVLLEAGGAPWKGRIMLQYTPFIPIGSVCNDLFKFNHFAWNAACRSAGFLNVTQAKYQSFGPAASSIPISVDDYVCTQNDRFLQNCTHALYGQHNCHHGEDAGVDCYPPPENTGVWQFRLADGTASTNGRLEMRPGSTFGWGSVCAGPYFNHTVAAWEAACRQVGIMNPPRARWRYFPKGSDTVYLDNVSCNAGDLFLVPNCTMFPLGSYRCSPTEIAGVDCNAPAEVPSQWQFRLTGGRSATSGRLEMRPDAATPYGAVCRRSLTSFEALRTICRTAGFPTATRPVVYRPLTPPPSTLPFYLDKAVCNASTPYLHNCSYAPLYSHDCSIEQGDALYIECFPTATPIQTPSETRSLAKTDSRSRLPTRSVVSTPSASARRTKSQPITPTGGWARARTATVTISRTKSPVATTTAEKPQTRSRTQRITATRTHLETRSHLQSDSATAATKPTRTRADTASHQQPHTVTRTHALTSSRSHPVSDSASVATRPTRTHADTLTLRPPPSTTGTLVATATHSHHGPSKSATAPQPSATTTPPANTASPSVKKTRTKMTAPPSPTASGTLAAPRSATATHTPVSSPSVPAAPTASEPRPSHTNSGPAASDTQNPTMSASLPRCDADRSALDSILGTPLLRPLGTVYLAWPPTATSTSHSSTPFSVPLSEAAALGNNFLPVLDPSTDFTTTARLVDPATLQPINLRLSATSPSVNSTNTTATAAASNADVISVAVRRLVTTPMHLNASIAVTDPTSAATILPPGSVVLVAVPTADLLRCVDPFRTANMTIVARVVLVDATFFGGGAAGDGPLPPPPAREAEPPVEYQSAAAADEVAAMLLACEGGADSIASMAFFRMLSPFATGPAHAMVLTGSAAVTGLVLGAQVLTVVWMRARGKAKSLLACAAAARAPAVTIAVAEPLWFGVAYAGASLVVGAANNPLQIVAGAAACASTVAIPVLVVLGLRRYASRRIIAYKRVFPQPIPACLAPHIAPTTRVKPEVLVKVLAPLVSFRSLHPLFPASGSLSPAVTAIVVLLTGAIPGLCRLSHALIAIAHIVLAAAIMAVRPRRTTLLNAFAATHHLSIAAVFGWAALIIALPSVSVDRAEAVLYTFIVIQTGFVGCRIALTPLAFFSDRLLPYKGVRAIAEYVAPAAEVKDPLEFMPGHPDYFRDDEDRRLHNVDDDPILSSDSDDGDGDPEEEKMGGFLSFIPFFAGRKKRLNSEKKKKENEVALLVAGPSTTTAMDTDMFVEQADLASRVSLRRKHSSIPIMPSRHGESAVSLSSEYEEEEEEEEHIVNEAVDDDRQQEQQLHSSSTRVGAANFTSSSGDAFSSSHSDATTIEVRTPSDTEEELFGEDL